MSRQALIAVGAGTVSALTFMAFGIPGAVLLSYLAALPLLLTGFGMGAMAAAIAAASGVVAAVFLGGWALAASFTLFQAIPAWLVSCLILIQRQMPGGGVAWYPVGHILSWLVCVAAVLFLFANVIASAFGPGLIATLTAVVAQFDGQIAAFFPGLTEADRRVLATAMATYIPCGMTVNWVFMIIINGILAQAILVRRKRNRRPTPRIFDLELPGWIAWALVASAAIALLGTLMNSEGLQFVGRNLVIMFALPYFFLGLALVHTLLYRTPFPGTLLTIFYVVVIVPLWPMILVALAGMVEHWAGIRRHFSPPGGSKGSE